MKTGVKHLPAEERRAVTVEAVIALAAERNPNDITTAAIASRMGLTQGALFRHFPNKEAIIQAVMEWVAGRLIARIDKALKQENSPMRALECMFLAHISFITEHPGIPRLLFGELQGAEETSPKRMVQTMIQHYRERLHSLIDEGKKRGEIEKSIDTYASATLFIGTIQGLVMQSLLAGDVSQIQRDAPHVYAIYCRGIRSDK